MRQTIIKRIAAGTATSNSEYMFVGYDRSVAAVLGVTAAVVIEWVRHSSQYGKYAPEWRARRKQVGELLMLSESAVKRALRKVKESGVIVIREVPERMSYNGYALHFSVNANKLEGIKSKGREIMLRDGWLKSPKVTVTKGQKRPSVGKGSEGLQRPVAGEECGSNETLSGGRLRVSVDPLTINNARRVHTLERLRSLRSLRFARVKKKNILVVRNPRRTTSRNPPPIASPPVAPLDCSAASREDAVTPLLTDLINRFGETGSIIVLCDFWRQIVSKTQGADKVVPLTARDKKNTEGQFIQWCRDANVTLPEFLCWCVENWDDISEGEMKWAKLDPLPTFGRIFALRDKLMPHFLKNLDMQREESKATLEWQESERLDEEERTRAEAAERKAALLYKHPDEVPSKHPLREEISRQLTENGATAVVANHFKCKPLNALDIDEEKHQKLEEGWKRRTAAMYRARYGREMQYDPTTHVPSDHPQRDAILQYQEASISVFATNDCCVRVEDRERRYRTCWQPSS